GERARAGDLAHQPGGLPPALARALEDEHAARAVVLPERRRRGDVSRRAERGSEGVVALQLGGADLARAGPLSRIGVPAEDVRASLPLAARSRGADPQLPPDARDLGAEPRARRV